jgi:hypothetical protein
MFDQQRAVVKFFGLLFASPSRYLTGTAVDLYTILLQISDSSLELAEYVNSNIQQQHLFPDFLKFSPP